MKDADEKRSAFSVQRLRAIRADGGRVADLKDYLEIATAAAKAAGEVLRTHHAELAVIEAEQGREVKIKADKTAESSILQALAQRAPFPVISEEAGWVGPDRRSGPYAWAVDPLDGSVNYLRGYPHCAVSIALLHDDEPVLGVVECFLLGETFTAIVGEGAWLNGAPMRVSTIADAKKGILHTGIPARAGPNAMAKFETRLSAWQKVRMIGSAATALAYVAAGRAEAYRESGSMIWDVAGGCALVKAAGGVFQIGGEGLDGPLEVGAGNGLAPLPD